MFEKAPLLGRGIGRVDPDRYVETFGYKDVGPVFHDFYLTVLVNAGLVGLGLVLVLLFIASGLKRLFTAIRDGPDAALATGMRCALAGWAVAAIFAAPTDGHWELGLLPASVLLLDRFRSQTRTNS